MSFFDVTFDTNSLNRQLRKLSSKDQFAVFGRALRRSQQTMRKTAVGEVQKSLNLKAKNVREAVETRRVHRRALSAEVKIISRGQPIIGFNRTRQVRAGVSVQIKKGGGRRVIKGAFITTLRSGKKSVFQRRVNRATKKRAARLPVDIVFSTSVRQALAERSSQERILIAGRDRFIKEARHEIRRKLGERF